LREKIDDLIERVGGACVFFEFSLISGWYEEWNNVRI
jgi:hypothetical protein